MINYHKYQEMRIKNEDKYLLELEFKHIYSVGNKNKIIGVAFQLIHTVSGDTIGLGLRGMGFRKQKYSSIKVISFNIVLL